MNRPLAAPRDPYDPALNPSCSEAVAVAILATDRGLERERLAAADVAALRGEVQSLRAGPTEGVGAVIAPPRAARVYAPRPPVRRAPWAGRERELISDLPRHVYRLAGRPVLFSKWRAANPHCKGCHRKIGAEPTYKGGLCSGYAAARRRDEAVPEGSTAKARRLQRDRRRFPRSRRDGHKSPWRAENVPRGLRRAR